MNTTLEGLQIVVAVLYVVHAVAHIFPSAMVRKFMDEQNIPRMRVVSSWLELLGAVGLVLPGLVAIATSLTPLAALGLVPRHDWSDRVPPLSTGILVRRFSLAFALCAAFVAYGRTFVTPPA